MDSQPSVKRELIRLHGRGIACHSGCAQNPHATSCPSFPVPLFVHCPLNSKASPHKMGRASSGYHPPRLAVHILEQDVGWAQIAVDNALGVDVGLSGKRRMRAGNI